MSLLLLFGGGSAGPPAPVDPETVPQVVQYELDMRRTYTLDAQATYRPDNREEYPL